EAQPALVRPDRGVHLDAEATVHLDVAGVVDPRHAEHHDPLGLDDPLEDPCLSVARVPFERQLHRPRDLAHGLMELGLSGVLRSEPGHDAVRVVAHRSSPAFAPCSSAVHRTPGGAHMGSVARRTVRVGRRAGRPRGRCYRGSMPVWLLIPGAFVLGYVIWRVGMATLRSLAGPAPGTLDIE